MIHIFNTVFLKKKKKSFKYMVLNNIKFMFVKFAISVFVSKLVAYDDNIKIGLLL